MVAGELIFNCPRCFTTYPSDPDDTLISTNQTDTSYEKYSNIIRNAKYFNYIPREYKDCLKCKAPIVSYIRIGDEYRRLFICDCGNYFE
jgi:DNA-directed RNA polymerase subunit M/transcription elongation factor TFIIS